MERINVFTKGMNKDIHPSLVSNEEYYEAMNGVINCVDSAGSYTLSNEAGHAIATSFLSSNSLSNHLVIGTTSVGYDIVVFSIVYDKVKGQANPTKFDEIFNQNKISNPVRFSDQSLNLLSSSEVGLLTKDQTTGQYSYKTIVNDKNPAYWASGIIDYDENLWNFDPIHQIEATTRIDPLLHRVVYWTDGFNRPRFLNLDYDYTDPNSGRQFKHLAEQTELFEVKDIPIVRFNRIKSGGTLRAGVYQFAVRYLNQTLDPTTFGPLCHPIPIVPNDRSEGRDNYDGAPIAPDLPNFPYISKSIELTLHNLDLDFSYAEVWVVYYTGPASIPQVRFFDRFPITASTIAVTFDGRVEDLDRGVSDLFKVPVSYRTAQHITQKDGRLILANLTDNPIRDCQSLANSTKILYTIREVPFSPDADYFEDYKEENNTFSFKGYRRGETYSFGLVVGFKDGTESYVHHIPGNTQAAPYINDEGFGELNAYTSTIKYPTTPVVPPNYYNSNGVSLNGKPILHHKFPTLEQEPHIKIDNNGNTWLRIMGIQLTGIDTFLELNPEFARKVAYIHVVRESRQSFENKSVYASGCVNRLLKQRGRNPDLPKYFNVKFNLGFGELAVPPLLTGIIDFALTALNVGINAALKVAPILNYRDRFQPANILPTYHIDPFYNTTEIEDGNSTLFFNGSYTTSNAEDYVAFYSPETDISDYILPVGSKFVPKLYIKGDCKRIISTRKDEFYLFRNGSYSHKLEEPYNDLYRAPYYHLFADFSKEIGRFNNDNPNLNIFDLYLRGVKNNRWNDACTNNGIIADINTRIGELGASAVTSEIKLNSYETERTTILRLKNTLEGSNIPYDYGISSLIFPDRSVTSAVDIKIASTFLYYVFPYLPFQIINLIVKLNEDSKITTGNPLLAVVDAVALMLKNIAALAPALLLSIAGGCGALTNRRRVEPSDLFDYFLQPYQGDNRLLINGEWLDKLRGKITNQEIYRDIFNIEYPNPTQYGQLDSDPYILVDTLHDKGIIGGSYRSQDFYLKDMRDFRSEPIYNGDTFITKYFWKSSHNVAARVAIIEQNELNRSTLTYMATGGFNPLLTLPGSILTGVSDIFPLQNGDGIAFGLIEALSITDKRLADPIFPAREGVNLRGGNWVWLESSINSEYRHRPISYIESAAKSGGLDQFSPIPDPDNARLGVPYYPKDSLAWCFEASPEFGQSNGYNFQYSKENDLRVYIGRPFGAVNVTEYPTRIIYSEHAESKNNFGEKIKSEVSDRYRQFLHLSYQDLPKNKGEITNVFEQSFQLYAHTKQSLFRLFFNSKNIIVPQSEQQLFLGTGSVLQDQPQEVYPINGGYAGCQNKWACAHSPFGYYFVDREQQKVFLMTDQPEEISQAGLLNFFIENLNLTKRINDPNRTNPSSTLFNPKYLNNPANPLGLGINGVYDFLHRRFILSIKQAEDTIQTFGGNTSVPFDSIKVSDSNTTVSFSNFNNRWVSLHSYTITEAVSIQTDLYSFPRRIDENNVYIHNITPDSTNQFQSNFGLYYPRVSETLTTPLASLTDTFYIIFISNDNPTVTKVFDNLTSIVQFIDVSTNTTNPLGIVRKSDFFDTIECWNEYQKSSPVPLTVYPNDGDLLSTNTKVYQNQYQSYIPHSETINPPLSGLTSINERHTTIDIFDPNNIGLNINQPRFKSKYLFIKLSYANSDKNFRNSIGYLPNLNVILNSIISKYRINFR